MPEVTVDPDVWWDDGGVLMHIGPHKTGTTGLQHSLAAARPRLAKQSVLYPGKAASHYRPSRERVHGSPELWRELVAEINGQDRRAIVSSEYLDRVDEELAPEIVEELGGLVRILITVRPLNIIIPSLWQQHVKSGSTADLAPWTADLFRRGPEHPSWRSVDHRGLIEQWQEVVGPDRVLILIGDSRNPEMLLQGFEGAAGLTAGTLEPPDRVNRSMTATESELALALNRQVSELGISAKQQVRWIRRGIYAPLVEGRQVPSGEPKLVLPESVRGDVAIRQGQVVDLLRTSDSRVVGDPNSLLTNPIEASISNGDQEAGSGAVPIDLASSMITALLEQSLAHEYKQKRKRERLRRKLRGKKQPDDRSGSSHSRWPWRR